MIQAVEIVAVLLVAIAMAFALAHVAELPGKLRLDEASYRAVQRIYYPGFTIGGAIGEVGGTLALVVLVVATPAGTPARAYFIVAMLAMLAMQGVFWLLTQPVNRAWLSDLPLSRAGALFFGRGRDPGRVVNLTWTSLRNIWESSHAIRAVLAVLALVLALLAVTTRAVPA